MSHTLSTRDGLKNMIFCSVHSKKFVIKFSWPIRVKKACFSWISVHKNFKNHFYSKLTWFLGPQTKHCPGNNLSHFQHENPTPNRGTTAFFSQDAGFPILFFERPKSSIWESSKWCRFEMLSEKTFCVLWIAFSCSKIQFFHFFKP